jgi:uncharacterized protein YneF (UPF0154 family)
VGSPILPVIFGVLFYYATVTQGKLALWLGVGTAILAVLIIWMFLEWFVFKQNPSRLWLRGITLFLCIALLGGAFIWQRGIKSDEAFVFGERPSLGVSDIKMHTFKVGEKVQASIAYTNAGRAPARLFGGDTEFFITPFFRSDKCPVVGSISKSARAASG